MKRRETRLISAVVVMALIALVLATTACEQPVNSDEDAAPSESQADTPTDTPTGEPSPQSDPAPTGEGETQMNLQALPVYPAYYVTDTGAIFGIPATLQGLKHKEKIEVLEVYTDENDDPATRPAPVHDFWITDGAIFVTIQYNEPPATEGEEPTIVQEHFRQALGSDTIEATATPAEKPEIVRMVGSVPGFRVDEALREGVMVSELWNQYESFVTDATPNGAGPFRYPMIHAVERLDYGLVFGVGSELLYLPANRASVNSVAGAGRLWK